ncbi:glutamate 5-kinase [Deinococcus misasensis]|uniref:glutamate 5-kinase n=1 Tax=Deinococcus misasensis TaxID=392413 RepID=UPI000553194B|nr:glutamate 5-kinase [Deinococcus misasensis]
MKRRIVLKIGSSSLTDETGRIQPEKLQAIAEAFQTLDAEVALVSSGAVAAGCGLLNVPRPRTLPEKQALAAVGQAALMQEWAKVFAPRAVAQILLSAGDIQDRKRFINAKHALEAAFKLGVVPIINENDTVATQELRLGDNDTLSAWVAYLCEAHELILLTDVDGLYTANPRTDPTAQRLSLVENVAEVLHLAGGAGSSRGTGGMHTKLKAAQIASEAGIDTLIVGGGGAGLKAFFAGADTGTRIRAQKHTARRGWILHQPSKGTLFVDAGAEKALKSGKSLLPKGITGLAGEFQYGEIVRLEGESGPIGQGIVNYAAHEVQRIFRRHTEEIEEILGYKDFDEVVHRNHLALF